MQSHSRKLVVVFPVVYSTELINWWRKYSCDMNFKSIQTNPLNLGSSHFPHVLVHRIVLSASVQCCDSVMHTNDYPLRKLRKGKSYGKSVGDSLLLCTRGWHGACILCETIFRQRPSRFTAKVADSSPVPWNSAQMYWRPWLGDNFCRATHILGQWQF